MYFIFMSLPASLTVLGMSQAWFISAVAESEQNPLLQSMDTNQQDSWFASHSSYIGCNNANASHLLPTQNNFFRCCLFNETSSHYVAPAGLEPSMWTILIWLHLREIQVPLLPECWGLKACATTLC